MPVAYRLFHLVAGGICCTGWNCRRGVWWRRVLRCFWSRNLGHCVIQLAAKNPRKQDYRASHNAAPQISHPPHSYRQILPGPSLQGSPMRDTLLAFIQSCEVSDHLQIFKSPRYTGGDFMFLSHPGIPGVTLCFCTGSYAAEAGRRFLFTR